MKAATLRWLLVLVVATLATAAAALSPRALRRMEAFHVQQVEVVGAHYLAAQEAVAASGIAPTATVFDDFTSWRAALLRHPLVLDAEITRRLPFTVVLHLTESRPLAFALLPELRPVDARGRILEIDPTRAGLDLPLLFPAIREASDVALRDPDALRVLAALGRVAELEPSLYALISEVAPLSRGVRLTLRDPAGAAVLLPDSPDAARLHLLRLTLADVGGGRSETKAAGEQPRLRRIDARFREQIVVALKPNEPR